MESSLTREACLLLATPTLVCFLLNTLERGLSIVDADDPEARDGVRVLGGTSSLGSRDVEVCVNGLELVMFGCWRWVGIGTVRGRLAWRELTRTGSFCTVGPRQWTCSSYEGLLFCSFDWPTAGICGVIEVVGVTDRCGSRVVAGARSSILLGGAKCDL